jgi:hypothetical protein
MTHAAKVCKIGKRKRFLMEQFFIGARTAAMRAPRHRVLAPHRQDLGRTHILASSTLEPRVRQIELEVENIFACVIFSSSEINPNQ